MFRSAAEPATHPPSGPNSGVSARLWNAACSAMRKSGRSAAAWNLVMFQRWSRERPRPRDYGGHGTTDTGTAATERRRPAIRPRHYGGHDPGGGSSSPSPQTSGPQKKPRGGGSPPGPARVRVDRRPRRSASPPATRRSPERRPSMELPARLEADPLERPLREDDVAVAGGVSVALAVADVHHAPTGRAMGQDPLRLQVPQTRHVGWPFTKSIDARRPSNVVRAVTTGSSPTPSASSAGWMKKPYPSDTISTGMPAACARRMKGTNPGSCG